MTFYVSTVHFIASILTYLQTIEVCYSLYFAFSSHYRQFTADDYLAEGKKLKHLADTQVRPGNPVKNWPLHLYIHPTHKKGTFQI